MHPALDIAIAGSGIAGLAAAALLCRDGHRVTVFEQFAAPRPVGSGLLLQPTGMAVLAALGLDQEAIALGARIKRLHGRSDGRDVLDVRYASLGRNDGFAVGIERSALFDLLFGAARGSGAGIVAAKCAASFETRGCKAWLAFADGSSDGPFDLVIDACGSRSPLAGPIPNPMPFGALWATVEDRAGAAAPATLSQRYKRAEQMAGLLPIGGSKVALFWSLRGSELEAARARGIESWRGEWRALWPEAGDYAEQVANWESFSFASYRHRTLSRPAGDRIVHIGDSWHATSPQLGQGANMALLDAFALAAAVRSANALGDRLDRFVRSRRAHVLLYQAMSRLLTPVYQSGSIAIPYVRDRIVAPLSRLRSLNRLQAMMVAGLIGDPLGRLGLEPDRTFTDRSSPR